MVSREAVCKHCLKWWVFTTDTIAESIEAPQVPWNLLYTDTWLCHITMFRSPSGKAGLLPHEHSHSATVHLPLQGETRFYCELTCHKMNGFQWLLSWLLHEHRKKVFFTNGKTCGYFNWLKASVLTRVKINISKHFPISDFNFGKWEPFLVCYQCFMWSYNCRIIYYTHVPCAYYISIGRIWASNSEILLSTKCT